MANALTGSRDSAQQAQGFMTEQIADYEKKLGAAEGRLADFKRQHAGLVPGATGGDYFSRLNSATDELNKQRQALTMAEQKRDELQRQLSERAAPDRRLGGDSAPAVPPTPAARSARRRAGSMNCCCAIPTSTRMSSRPVAHWRI